MNRCFTAVVVVLVVTSVPSTSVAQARGGHGTGQHAPPTGSVRPPSNGSTGDHPQGRSSTSGRFTSTLTFVPPPLTGEPRGPLVFPALAWGSLGFFWPLYAMPSSDGYSDSLRTQVPEPPRDSLPTGGLQLDVDPRRAQVYVDGEYVGPVDNFSGYYHHLDLAAGRHRIEIFAPSYQPLIMDVMISPGRTTTYRNTLPRVPGGD